MFSITISVGLSMAGLDQGKKKDSACLKDALVLLETAMEQIGKFFKENKFLG